MAKKQDSFYYENFSQCVACACQAAHYLEDALKNFQPERLHAMLDELHQVEHAADEKKHELSNVLARAFITPIEREDIILLSQSIDEVTDKIEDVMLRFYCNNIQAVRPDAIELGAVLVSCCEELRLLLEEFRISAVPKSCGSTSFTSTPWRSRPTSCLSTTCGGCTPPPQIRWRSSAGGRFTSTWKNAPMPVSMWPTPWKASL